MKLVNLALNKKTPPDSCHEHELMKFEDLDLVELIKKEKEDKKKPEKGVKAFFVSKYYPRMPHPLEND